MLSSDYAYCAVRYRTDSLIVEVYLRAMSPIRRSLRSLLTAMRRYYVLRRSQGPLAAVLNRAMVVGAMDSHPVNRRVVNDHVGAKHGPIQITTVLGEPVTTMDGVTVQVTVQLAWSSCLSSVKGPHQGGPGRSAFDRSSCRHDEASVKTLAREPLRSMVPGCGLAALMSERQSVEEKVRMDIARQGAASGLNLHLVRIRMIDIPASVQAAGDAQALAAMRECVEKRRRLSCGFARARPEAAVSSQLTY